MGNKPSIVLRTSKSFYYPHETVKWSIRLPSGLSKSPHEKRQSPILDCPTIKFIQKERLSWTQTTYTYVNKKVRAHTTRYRKIVRQNLEPIPTYHDQFKTLLAGSGLEGRDLSALEGRELSALEGRELSAAGQRQTALELPLANIFSTKSFHPTYTWDGHNYLKYFLQLEFPVQKSFLGLFPYRGSHVERLPVTLSAVPTRRLQIEMESGPVAWTKGFWHLPLQESPSFSFKAHVQEGFIYLEIEGPIGTENVSVVDHIEKITFALVREHKDSKRCDSYTVKEAQIDFKEAERQRVAVNRRFKRGTGYNHGSDWLQKPTTSRKEGNIGKGTRTPNKLLLKANVPAHGSVHPFKSHFFTVSYKAVISIEFKGWLGQTSIQELPLRVD